MRHIFWGLCAVIGVSVLGMLVAAWSPAPPVDPFALKGQASAYDARIVRDDYGVPHIFAERDADAAFGLGYAHAEDDWKTIETVILLAKGMLSTRDGAVAAPTDYLVRLFGIREAVEAGYEQDLDRKTRALLSGYVAGLNLYAAEHPEEVSGEAVPVTEQDVVAGFAFRAPFFYGLEDVLQKLNEPTKDELALAPAVRHAFQLSDGAEFGSNAIAVAPARSSDGHTRLLINSHQPYTGPVAWYEAHVSSEEGWKTSGALFPGSPVILVGHNDHLGWAHTVNKPDLIDVYRLKVDDPEDPQKYYLDGEWKAFERSKANIRVRLFGPFQWTFQEPVLRSVHGPVLATPNGVYALAFSGAGEIRAVEQWYQMNKARDLDEWMTAMSMLAVPSLNTVYGDGQGNIAFIYNARIPERQPGHDYTGILPGDDSSLLWRGTLPFSDVPKIINPKSGFLVNANATPLRSSAPEDDLSLSDIPETLAVERHLTNRASRALTLFGQDGIISEDDFLRYKFDKTYGENSTVRRFVDTVTAQDLKDRPLLHDAQSILRNWDGSANRESEEAALAILSTMKATDDINSADWEIHPVDALQQTVRELMDHYGRLRVKWGDINQLHRGDDRVALGGGPDTLRAVYGGSVLTKDGVLYANAGDSFIMLADWDENGLVKSQAIHQFGAATLDEDSPHYADQMPLFAAEMLRPMIRDEEKLLEGATRVYRPGH